MPEDNMKRWLEKEGYATRHLVYASADAGFRRYFRLVDEKRGESYIVMDASARPESLIPFVDIAARLESVDVHVPKIISKNMKSGFLLLEDLGTQHLLDRLTASNATTLYKEAIETLIRMQSASCDGLPLYDRAFLLEETGLMKTWYLEGLFRYRLRAHEEEKLEALFSHIADTVLQQPQGVFVHRDYHGRNIMTTPRNDLGIIDFQDARSGGVTYDLVSLLKDCYFAYDREEAVRLALYFRDRKGIDVDDETFVRWFDYTGMQRHAKVLGVFARLHLRDGKSGYLKDIPLTRSYLLETAKRYEETGYLVALLETFPNEV